MKNTLFKNYFQNSMNEVELNDELKRKLTHRLFEQKSSFWKRYKAFFVLPAGVALALGVFITLKPLPPQEALAQALQNIFNIESFESTFGMSNDGNLHHKTISKKSVHVLETDQEISTNETVELWSDGENVRQDNYIFNDQGEKNGSGVFSLLANLDEDLFCQHSEEFTGARLNDCKPLSVYEKENMNLMVGEREFIPQFKETVLGDFSEFKIESYEVQDPMPNLPEVFKQNWYTLNFSTLDPLPMNANQVWLGSRPLAWNQGGFINDIYSLTEFKDPSFYNHFENGRYWHKYLFQTSDDTLYFQFNTTKKTIDSEGLNFNYTKDEIKNSSRLYKIDLKEGRITPVEKKEIEKEQNFPAAYSVLNLIKEELTNSTLRPAYYIMNNLDAYKEPLTVQIIEKKGKKVSILKYLLKNTPEVDPSLLLSGKNYIYFYMDEAQINFLGYVIQNEQGEELQSVWIKDQILPQEDKEKVFSQEEWAKKWL